MRRAFKIEKIPLETLINLLIELYEKGIDYVDLFSDNSDPTQDKLIIQTMDSYINEEFIKDGVRSEDEDDEDDAPPRKPPTIETKRLTDDDINELL